MQQLGVGPFDWVIIDTPPILAVTDAVILAPVVSGVTFVLGAEMTRWRLAERAIDTLQAGRPKSISAVLNRVGAGQSASSILGSLQSNGRVFLINPNGIVFGAGSQVNVAGLVASTLNLSDADFLAGRMRFTDGLGKAVVNDSTFKLAEPSEAPAVHGVAQAIVSQCAQLSIDDFVANNDTNVSRIRLDTPMVAIHMEFKDGTSRDVKGGRTFETFVYVQHPARKDIVKLSSWRFDPFKKKVSDLMVVAGPAPAVSPNPAK